jgi:signal peptidase I
MSKQSGFIEVAVIGSFVFLLSAVTFIYWFVAQPYRMSGNSQLPTLVNGEYFMVKKYDREFKRGDIVVFKNPQDKSQDFVKRIIALPGDKIKIASGEAYINGTAITESYLKEAKKTKGRAAISEGQEVLVPSQQFFLLGDNREFSADSRDYGFINKNEIIGKYWFSYYK